MLHHDKAPERTSLLIREFLAKNETMVVPQARYSPDLALVDFFLFPKFKSTLKGRRFESTEKIEKQFADGAARDLKEKSFQDSFSKTEKRSWERCIKSGGEYFEGDKAE
jgi:hypothetical protein